MAASNMTTMRPSRPIRVHSWRLFDGGVCLVRFAPIRSASGGHRAPRGHCAPPIRATLMLARPLDELSRPLGRPALFRQAAVQVVRGRNDGDMRQPLRKIAELLSTRTDLLGKQPQMVGVTEQFLEDE